MTAPVSVEQICNMSLDAIGYPRSISNIFAGTKEARAALRWYGQTRDDVLRQRDWPFARQDVRLVLQKTAPVGGYPTGIWTAASPPPGWKYQYAYPTCIMVRSVRPAPFVLPDFDPKPWVFQPANDAATGLPTILTNLANANAVVTGQIINPTLFEPGFVQALVSALALQLQKALMPDELADK